MAKVTGGLFSLSASGQLVKTLVYSKWKGLKTVRQFVIPANPKSADQTTQRGYLGNGVEMWRNTDMVAADYTAWDKLAEVQSTPMSGFNMCVKSGIEIKLGGQNISQLVNAGDGGDTPEQITASIDAETGKAVSVRWGESPTSLINVQALSEDAGTYDADIASLVTGKKYYFQFYFTTEALNKNVSGIYEIVCP